MPAPYDYKECFIARITIIKPMMERPGTSTPCRVTNILASKHSAQLTNLAAAPAHLNHHLKIVKESAVLRRLIGTANGIIESAYGTRPIDDQVENLLNQSESDIFAVADASDSG